VPLWLIIPGFGSNMQYLFRLVTWFPLLQSFCCLSDICILVADSYNILKTRDGNEMEEL
jgi:hypothetical protein